MCSTYMVSLNHSDSSKSRKKQQLTWQTNTMAESLYDSASMAYAKNPGQLPLSDEFGRGEQQRRVLAVTDTPQVVEMAVSEQDHVDIARCVARAGEVAKQPAGRVLELVDAAARVDQHQFVAHVAKDSVNLQSHRAKR